MTFTETIGKALEKHTALVTTSFLAVAAVVGWYLGGLGGKKSPAVSGLTRRSRRRFR